MHLKAMLTKDFSEQEMACQCGKCTAKMSPTFMTMLQTMRDTYGKPMRITSAARCRKHNDAIGGADESRHLWLPEIGKLSDAVDIKCLDAAERFALVHSAIKAGMKGIGIHKLFIHVDSRPLFKMWLY